MRTQSNRARKLEQEMHTDTQERQFISWPANPWTDEQKAEAVRRHPEQRVFWRSLLETPQETAAKMADPSAEL